MKKAVFILIISTFIAYLPAGSPKVELVKGKNGIDVLIDGQPVTS